MDIDPLAVRACALRLKSEIQGPDRLAEHSGSFLRTAVGAIVGTRRRSAATMAILAAAAIAAPVAPAGVQTTTASAAGKRLSATAARTRFYDCSDLLGGGTRSNPWRIPSRIYSRTIVSCPGFPLGQGTPDWYAVRIPRLLDDDDNVSVVCRPTPAEPAEVSLVMDDWGPYALNIRGARYISGPNAWRFIYLKDSGIGPGWWYVRASRLLAVSSAPHYRVYVDLR